MTALIVIGCILLVLVLLALLRVGIRIIYNTDGLVLHLQLGPIRMILYPRAARPEKKARRRKKKAEKEKPPAPEKEGPGSLKKFMELLPGIRKALSRLRRKLRVDLLILHMTIPGKEDPAGAAIGFGRSSALLHSLLALLENLLDVRRRDVTVQPDFAREETEVYVEARLTLAVWHVFYIAFGFLGGVLKKRNTSGQNRKETVSPQRDNSKKERPVSK